MNSAFSVLGTLRRTSRPFLHNAGSTSEPETLKLAQKLAAQFLGEFLEPAGIALEDIIRQPSRHVLFSTGNANVLSVSIHDSAAFFANWQANAEDKREYAPKVDHALRTTLENHLYKDIGVPFDMPVFRMNASGQVQIMPGATRNQAAAPMLLAVQPHLAGSSISIAVTPDSASALARAFGCPAQKPEPPESAVNLLEENLQLLRGLLRRPGAHRLIVGDAIHTGPVEPDEQRGWRLSDEPDTVHRTASLIPLLRTRLACLSVEALLVWLHRNSCNVVRQQSERDVVHQDNLFYYQSLALAS